MDEGAEVADRLAIQDVLQRYGQALDEKDYALLDGVFAPGARLHYAMDTATDSTYPEMVDSFRRFLEVFWYTQHVFSHPVIDLEGDTARTTCRLIATHVQIPLDGGERPVWTVYGTYRDAWLRTPGGWRIRQRDFRALHSEGTRLPRAQVECFPAPPAHDRPASE